mgnify:FL=1
MNELETRCAEEVMGWVKDKEAPVWLDLNHPDLHKPSIFRPGIITGFLTRPLQYCNLYSNDNMYICNEWTEEHKSGCERWVLTFASREFAPMTHLEDAFLLIERVSKLVHGLRIETKDRSGVWQIMWQMDQNPSILVYTHWRQLDTGHISLCKAICDASLEIVKEVKQL